MIPASFDYDVPQTLEQAVHALTQRSGARLLAGGYQLLAAMKTRSVRPSVLVDLRKIEALRDVRLEPKGLHAGAMSTLAQVQQSIAGTRDYLAVSDVVGDMGDVQFRNQATIGGVLADEHPAAGLPAVAVALAASISTVSAQGSETLAAETFFSKGDRSTLIMTNLHFPIPEPRTGSAYLKARAVSGGYPICGVALTVTLGERGVIERCRVVLDGVGARAQRIMAVEDLLAGTPVEADGGVDMAAALQGVQARADRHASAEYRLHLASVLISRALRVAAERARQG